MRKRLLIPAAFIIFLFTACQAQEAYVDTTLALNNMAFELADASNMTVHNFNLGFVELTTPEGYENTVAPIRGIISLPNTNNAPHPMVVILHGRGGFYGEENLSYAGFDYLVAQLAAQGFVALSISVSGTFDNSWLAMHDFGVFHDLEQRWMVEIFEAHLHYLTQANAGQDVGHGIDLAALLNFYEIHLIGHSRSGALVDSLARADIKQSSGRIASLIRLNPLVFDHDTPHPDLPISILLSEFDDDFPDHPGQSVFDDILIRGNHQSLASVVYLIGGNHNFANRYFEEDDRERAFFTLAHESEERWITREEQEYFILHYVASFLDVVTGRRDPWGIFNPSEPQPVSMFGFDVIASTYSGTAVSIFSANERQARGKLEATEHTQSPIRYGNPHFFIHPITYAHRNGLELLSLIWRDYDAKITFVPTQNNFSEHQALSIYASVDSSNEINPTGQSQGFTVSLKDESGASKRVVIPSGVSALIFHPGMVFELPEFDESLSADIMRENDFHPWQGSMPLAEIRIPLSHFSDIDLSSIVEIGIYFDQTPSGAVMLWEMFLK